ncbi:MAG: adenylate kinase family protein [Candidatus Caldarchaeum sp.]
MIIWITGTPGVGKTTIGKMIAKLYRYRCIDLPEFVTQTGVGEVKPDGIVVDVRKLRGTLARMVEDDTVFSGHIVVKLPGRRQKCIVLRCNPLKLANRLRRRGYSSDKVVENVEAEFVGVVYLDAVKQFGHRNVVQVDVTKKTVSETVRYCREILDGKVVGDKVDWLTDLDEKELDQVLSLLARPISRQML